MKNNKILIIIGVVLLNILVVYMVGQSLLGKQGSFEKTLTEARTYAEQDLCEKAIAKYNEAVVTKDSVELRLEMIKVYEKGIEIGEITKLYDVFVEVEAMVDKFAKEVSVYEAATDIFLKYEQYEACANVLMQARDLGITSDKLTENLSKVRYQYTKVFGMYKEVLPVFDETYMVKTEDSYTYLGDDGSPALDGGYTYATSFSEGLAFVKTENKEAGTRSFLVNKDGERQVYLKDVKESSGVGVAKNSKGEEILLLACKVGDKYKYFDINGNEAFGEYEFAGRFRNNVAAVKESEGVWKLIDGTGNAITDKTFSDVVLNEFDECAPKGLIIAKENDKYHIYDINVNQIGDFSCDNAKAFVDDYAAFKNGDKWGYVDANGTIIIEPQYNDAKSFSYSMAGVKTADGWVFINPKNEVVIEETFEDVDYLNEKGVCFVKFDGFWSYLKMYYTGK